MLVGPSGRRLSRKEKVHSLALSESLFLHVVTLSLVILIHDTGQTSDVA